MKRAATLASGILAAAAACTPTSLPAPGHIVLYVDTNAPLPSLTRAPYDAFVPAPVFDTLRVELYAPGASTPCPLCTHEFEATVEQFRAGASIVVEGATAGAQMRARVVLFRAADAIASVPKFHLESWVALLPMPSEGALERRVVLEMDDFGAPRGTPDAPIEAEIPTSSMVGTWPGAVRRACTAPAPRGAVCVPGGAYVMGDRLLTGYGQFDADELKLVTVSPFFVDAHEVTVAEYRTGGGTTGAKDLVAWSGALDGTRFEDWCTYTGTPGPHENYPLNCIVQRAARRFCQSRGGDLPTEAQFEYLEGGLQGQRFPWGSDVPDACDTAVWGRGGWPGFSATSAFSSSCRASDPATPREAQIGYPAPVDDPSQRKLDVIAIGPGLVQDIAGDLTEWTRDGFAPQDSPCWRGDRVLRDPDCPPTDEKAEMAIRGGSWLVLGVAAGRGSALPNEANLSIGFRCVYPAD